MGDPGDAPLRRTPTLAKPPFAAIKKSLSHRL